VSGGITAARVADFLGRGLLDVLVDLFKADTSLYALLGELLASPEIGSASARRRSSRSWPRPTPIGVRSRGCAGAAAEAVGSRPPRRRGLSAGFRRRRG